MQLQPLNTSNPLHLSWQYGEVHIEIMGGIRLEGLDRLKVTLKVKYKQSVLRSNLDLYNDAQVEKLVRKTAELFSLGSSYMAKVLEELTNALEAHRITSLQQLEVKKEKKVLSPEEKREAITFLQQPNLVKTTGELIGASGVIGEEHNRLLMYLIFTSRKRENPLHIVSLAASGTGKSYLQERVAALIPDEDKIEMTVLSENAFYYFGQQELQHKLMLIEDLEGAQQALYPLRELQSKNKLVKRVVVKDKNGNTQTVEVTVEGPVCVAGCTTQEHIYEDNANRSFLIYLDDSKAQDGRIMLRQKQASAGIINFEVELNARNLLQNCQRVLEPVKVRNPYALQLQLPAEVFKIRRAHAQYLHFIEAITFYKQYQRDKITNPVTGEQYIETTLDDIEEANELMKVVLVGKSDELSHATRVYLEQVKEYLQQQGKDSFTTREVREGYKLNISNQKRYMLHLLLAGYIQKQAGKDNVMEYTVTSYDEYVSLQDRVKAVLDKALNGLREQQSSQVVQVGSEPPKSNADKESKRKFKSSPKGNTGTNNS
ncbi:hypothetical protein SAMN05421788_106244 [Filimonas lacunae]|uniref:Uncharacterized protein n=1 Tax=Filimonas lacunae TaxID=477680 RepID=A0A173MF78_9BACT|nr:hypothetical protein [Filimonas lacunae]BAV06180.1 DNA primase [Filimonas lacunae]SIT25126.1 hypothetical protein SAMN05421788_106244 [Filimonas lacunae]